MDLFHLNISLQRNYRAIRANLWVVLNQLFILMRLFFCEIVLETKADKYIYINASVYLSVSV